MSLLEILREPACQRLTWTLLHFVWQGLAVAAVLAATHWLVRPRRARSRYALCLAALVVMAACPLVTFVVLGGSMPRAAGSPAIEDATATARRPAQPIPFPGAAGLIEEPLPMVQSVPTEGPPESDAAASRPRLADLGRAAQPYLLAGWIAGVLALSARLLLGLLGVQGLRRSGQAIPAELTSRVIALANRLGLRSQVRVFVSEKVRDAIVTGLIRPWVLLPASWLAELPPDVLEAIIAHELAHVRRWDPWVGVLQRVVETLLFYHPAVWWLSRRVRLEREMCCDELAVSAIGKPVTYLKALEQAARRQLAAASPALGIAMGGRQTALVNRVRYLLGLGPLGQRARWWPAGLIAVLVLLAVGFTSTVVTRLGQREALAQQDGPSDAEIDETSGQQSGADADSLGQPDEETISMDVRGVVVDELDQPVAGALVRSKPPIEGEVRAVTADDGTFRLEFTGPRVFGVVQAISEDGARRGLVVLRRIGPSADPLRIVLRPSRVVTVHVADAEGRPVGGASVEVIAFHSSVATATTDARGRVEIPIPADAKVDWVIALKPGAGLDYFENYTSFPTVERPPLPNDVKVVLSGAESIQVQTLDAGGKPLPGVLVIPWTVKRPGKLSYLNFTGGGIAPATSDEEGMTRFDWLPADMEQGVTFETYHEDYHCPERPAFRVSEGNRRLRATFLRNARVSGRVTLPDGKPAARIVVQAEGWGATGGSNYYRGYATTSEDGSYRIKVYPEQSYIVAVDDGRWTAPSRAGIRLGEDEQIEGLDFQLAEGTLIHGTMTIGSERRPAVGDTATLIQYGPLLPPEFRTPSHERTQLVRWATTDENGHYAFRVSPGEYQLMLPHSDWGKPIELTVGSEKEIVHDGHVPRPERGTLTGLVVDQQGKPVAGCTVYGESIGSTGHAGFHTTTDAEGRFSTERWQDEMYLYVTNPEANLAGYQTISADATDVTVKLDEASTVVGWVYDTGGKPVPDARVVCIVGIPVPGCDRINLHAETDQDGKYSIPGLAVGSRASIRVRLGEELESGPRCTVEKAGRLELSDTIVKLPEAARPVPSAPDAAKRAGTVPAPAAPGRPQQQPGELPAPNEPLTYTGKVTDKRTGQPIQNATVVVRRMLLDPDPQNTSKVLLETKHQTDRQGEYAFTISPEHAAHRKLCIELDVFHAEYAPRTGFGYSLGMIRKNEQLGGRPFFEHVQLQPGKEITGLVQTPDGKPAAGVAVSGYSVPEGEPFGAFSQTRTDENGRFRLVPATPGEAAFWLYPKRFAASAHVLKGKRGDLGVLRLEEGITLTGKLLDADGNPLSEVPVRVWGARPPGYGEVVDRAKDHIYRFALTGENGQFVLDPMPPGDYQLQPEDHFYDPGTQSQRRYHLPAVFLRGAVTLKEGEEPAPTVLRAVPHVTLEAQYVDSRGKPRSGHSVHLSGRMDQPGGESGYWSGSGRPDANGRIVMLAPRGLRQAKLLLMTNEHSSLRFQRSPDAPMQRGRELELGTLEADAKGILIYRYVAPIVRVKVSAEDGGNLSDLRVTGSYAGEGPDLRFEQQTDGRFRSSQMLPDEEVTVVATAVGHRPATQRLSLPEGAVQEMELVLGRR